jgi:MipA family protein
VPSVSVRSITFPKHPEKSHRPLRFVVTTSLAVGAAWFHVQVNAQTTAQTTAQTAAQTAAQAPDKSPTAAANPWSISVGLGVISTPEYEGASKRATGVTPDLNIKYTTRDFGSFSLGSKSRGLSWTMIDKEDYSFGIGIQGDGGRKDNKDGSAFQPGSKRLQGMGEIKPSFEVAAFGHVVLGVPLSLQVVKGFGDGKPDAKDFSIKGHGGTRVELLSEIPIEITKSFSLSIAPGVSWADSKFTQTYFGVTAAQAARSGYKEFKAKGGIRSISLGVGANYKFDSNWTANAFVNYSQLQGDAGKSPLVQKKGQASVILGATYQF